MSEILADAAPAPAVATAALPQTGRPAAVRVASLALCGAAVASLGLAASGVYGLTRLRGTVDGAMQVDPTGTASLAASGYLNQAQHILTGAAIGVGLLFALTYALVAFAANAGHRWPRPVGTVLAVLSLPVAFLGPVAFAIVAAGVVAVIALWQPQARAYALQRRTT